MVRQGFLLLTFASLVLSSAQAADPPLAKVEGTFVIPKDVPSFQGRRVEIGLWMRDSDNGEMPAYLLEEVTLKGFAHKSGKETRQKFVLDAGIPVEEGRSYYVTYTIRDRNTVTHEGKCKHDPDGYVLTDKTPKTVTVMVSVIAEPNVPELVQPKVPAKVDGTIVIPKEIPSFEGGSAVLELYKQDPSLADVLPTRLERTFVDGITHKTGKETRQKFVIDGEADLEVGMIYFLMISVGAENAPFLEAKCKHDPEGLVLADKKPKTVTVLVSVAKEVVDPPVQVEEPQAQTPAGPALKVGEVVWAEWQPNDWYRGKITKKTAKGFQILYDDGDTGEVDASKIAPDATPDKKVVKEGTRVLAKWTDGRFYPGKVGEVKADGSYGIEFDDGDKGDAKLKDLRLIVK